MSDQTRAQTLRQTVNTVALDNGWKYTTHHAGWARGDQELSVYFSADNQRIGDLYWRRYNGAVLAEVERITSGKRQRLMEILTSQEGGS